MFSRQKFPCLGIDVQSLNPTGPWLDKRRDKMCGCNQGCKVSSLRAFAHFFNSKKSRILIIPTNDLPEV